MMARRRFAAALALTSGCICMLAPGAGARPKPLLHYKPLPVLARRSCGGLLGKGSFPDAVNEEVNPIVTTHAGTGSICVFMAPEPTEAEQAAGEKPIGGGTLTLNVYDRVNYEFRGRERNIASLIPFPAFTRKDPASIGSHAYVGTSVNDVSEGADIAFGVAQIRNAVAIIAIEFPADKYPGGDPDEHVELLLKSVIADICHGCRR
jgi:hypothetical protein